MPRPGIEALSGHGRTATRDNAGRLDVAGRAVFAGWALYAARLIPALPRFPPLLLRAKRSTLPRSCAMRLRSFVGSRLIETDCALHVREADERLLTTPLTPTSVFP